MGLRALKWRAIGAMAVRVDAADVLGQHMRPERRRHVGEIVDSEAVSAKHVESLGHIDGVPAIQGVTGWALQLMRHTESHAALLSRFDAAAARLPLKTPSRQCSVCGEPFM